MKMMIRRNNMKKTVLLSLVTILLLSLNACVNKDQEYGYNIKDALKISAYLYDENSGEDYYVLNILGDYIYNPGDGVFELERLKLNEVRLMGPLGFNALNLNILFEFDGIIEVISEDKDVQLFYKYSIHPEPIFGTTGSEGPESYGYEMKLLNEGFVAVNPLGSNDGHKFVGDGIKILPHSVGREYYLNVNAYKFDSTEHAIIRARLKIVHLEDKAKGNNAKSSCCFSIEMVSYEYSDIYRIMNDIDDEDDD